MKIGDKSLILSDTESAYQLLCPKGHGVLVSIGTGIVCMGRNENKNSKHFANIKRKSVQN